MKVNGNTVLESFAHKSASFLSVKKQYQHKSNILPWRCLFFIMILILVTNMIN